MYVAPKVSVVISTYDRPGALVRCVESVLAQTYDDFEIIVVDDGSFTAKAALESLVDRANERDVRMVVLEMTENSGYQCAPKNLGIKVAQGELISHIDDDDEMLPRHLELLVGAIEEHDADLAYGRWVNVVEEGCEIDIEDGSEWVWVPFNHVTANLLMMGPLTNFIASATVFKRNKALETFGKFVWNENMRRFGDWDLWKRMYLAKFKIVGVNEATFKYHWHGQNLQLVRPVNESTVKRIDPGSTWKGAEECL